MNEQKLNTSEIGHIIFPETGEKVEFALLKISGSNIILEFPTDSKRVRSVKRYDVIIGVFNGIGDVTMIECNYGGSQIGGSKNILKLEVNYLLKGIQISKYSDLTFSKAIVSFSTLFSWLNSRIISYSSSDESPLKIKYPKDIQIGTLEKFKLSVTHFLSQQFGGKSISYSQDTCIKIETNDEELSIWELLESINEFKKFIMMFTNSYPTIGWINLYTDKLKTPETKSQASKRIEVKLLLKNRSGEDSVLPFSPSIKYNDIKGDLVSIVESWYTNKDLAISANLILEKSFNLELSRENYFLNNCFAFETFHRLFVNDAKMILKKRLLDLENDFIRLLPEGEDIVAYLKVVVDTRNHYVHRSPKKRVFKGVDLYYAASYMETIVKLNIYRVLGVSEDLLIAEFKRAKQTLKDLYDMNKRRNREG